MPCLPLLGARASGQLFGQPLFHLFIELAGAAIEEHHKVVVVHDSDTVDGAAVLQSHQLDPLGPGAEELESTHASR